ncbi:MAG: hypothetical protein ACOYJK_05900 [Prevotella sp.]|jgi:hypothetical protein
MTRKDIEHIGWKYRRQGLLIIGTLFLVALLVVNIGRFNVVLTPLIVCAVYALVFEMLEGVVWTKVAKNSTENLPTFFMAVSGVRILTALAVMLAYYLAVGRSAMLVFLLFFAVFYVAILGHHVAFFRKHTDISIDE